jgi:hypothetical protein
MQQSFDEEAEAHGQAGSEAGPRQRTGGALELTQSLAANDLISGLGVERLGFLDLLLLAVLA